MQGGGVGWNVTITITYNYLNKWFNETIFNNIFWKIHIIVIGITLRHKYLWRATPDANFLNML